MTALSHTERHKDTAHPPTTHRAALQFIVQYIYSEPSPRWWYVVLNTTARIPMKILSLQKMSSVFARQQSTSEYCLNKLQYTVQLWSQRQLNLAVFFFCATDKNWRLFTASLLKKFKLLAWASFSLRNKVKSLLLTHSHSVNTLIREINYKLLLQILQTLSCYQQISFVFIPHVLYNFLEARGGSV